MSLIEIMIALTMTLIVLGAMMTAFQSVSQRMQTGRAMIELANRVRNVESTLRNDLSSMTVEPRPYTTTFPAGFFQIVEGSRNDSTMANTISNVIGDVDDAISMTIQTKGQMFRGRYDPDFDGVDVQIHQSPIAEVVWFPYWNEKSQIGVPEFEDSIELHRRVLLVRPDAILPSNLNWEQVRLFFLANDISARIEPIPSSPGQFRLVANQLADLAIRKNRFGHLPGHMEGNPLRGAYYFPNSNPNLQPVYRNGLMSDALHVSLGFPNPLNYRLLERFSIPETGESPSIILTDVVGFDVRVFSPNANLRSDNANPSLASVTMQPGDLLTQGLYVNHGDFGAFVDLGFQNLEPPSSPNEPLPWFSGPFAFKGSAGLPIWPPSTWPSPAGFPIAEFVFDTWTPAYESDGIDQDANSIIDQGTDGLDNDNINGVDDIGERETLPPYNHPIRGIEIRIRTVERVTKQVHQTTIIHSFVPE